jgi:hypothetical protein
VAADNPSSESAEARRAELRLRSCSSQRAAACCQKARSFSSTACRASSRHSSICLLTNRSNAQTSKLRRQRQSHSNGDAPRISGPNLSRRDLQILRRIMCMQGPIRGGCLICLECCKQVTSKSELFPRVAPKLAVPSSAVLLVGHEKGTTSMKKLSLAMVAILALLSIAVDSHRDY